MTKVNYEGQEFTLITEPVLEAKYPILDYGTGYATSTPIQYDFEYTAKAVGADGKSYLLYWMFEEGEPVLFTEPYDIECMDDFEEE